MLEYCRTAEREKTNSCDSFTICRRLYYFPCIIYYRVVRVRVVVDDDEDNK